MRKKPIYLFTLALVAAGAMSLGLTSCSQNEEELTTRSSNLPMNAIGFTTYADNIGGTRATPTTASNYLTLVPDFKVWGYFTGGTEYYLGNQGADGVFINHTSGQSDWNYKTATDMVYWPTAAGKTLDFYAITPSENAAYQFNGSNLTYTVPTDNAAQVDLMLAQANGQTKTTNAGKVALAFKHKLSQIVFKGITNNSRLSVEVKSITIKNVRNSITLAMGGNGAGTPGSNFANYAVGLASPKTVANTSTSIDLTDATGALLLVPQTLTPWTVPSATSSADGKHETYLDIECKITSATSTGVSYLVGSASSYGHSYVPLGGDWQEGKRYVYTLQFGVGKDENGNDISSPITFTVSVNDWAETPTNVTL